MPDSIAGLSDAEGFAGKPQAALEGELLRVGAGLGRPHVPSGVGWLA